MILITLHYVHSLDYVLYFYYKVEKVTLCLKSPTKLCTKVDEEMPTKEVKARYDMQYAKTKLKRIPLDVQKEKYEEIKSAAERFGESVNGYIKKAIDERMKREQ